MKHRQSSHIDIEEPLFDGKPHIWLQWKGTDVCCDIHCACGAHLHFDGDFFYFFRCPHCDQHWEVGSHVAIYPVTKEQMGGIEAKEIERDEDRPPKGSAS